VTPSRGERGWLVLLVGCLATLAVAFLVWATRGGWPGTTTSSGADAVGRSTSAATGQGRDPAAPSVPVPSIGDTAAPADEATPTELVVPAVDVRMPVVGKGVAADGQMALPPDPRRVGWYRFGPSPTTERGSAVLAGHVDSKRYGIGPLSRLRQVATGDVIRVEMSDGRAITFRTTSVRSIAKDALPLDAVFARSGRPRLRIVTCGGEYDARTGGYRDNVVVTAIPLGDRRP
jgi:hypothetical protein